MKSLIGEVKGRKPSKVGKQNETRLANIFNKWADAILYMRVPRSGADRKSKDLVGDVMLADATSRALYPYVIETKDLATFSMTGAKGLSAKMKEIWTQVQHEAYRAGKEPIAFIYHKNKYVVIVRTNLYNYLTSLCAVLPSGYLGSYNYIPIRDGSDEVIELHSIAFKAFILGITHKEFVAYDKNVTYQYNPKLAERNHIPYVVGMKVTTNQKIAALLGVKPSTITNWCDAGWLDVTNNKGLKIVLNQKVEILKDYAK